MHYFWGHQIHWPLLFLGTSHFFNHIIFGPKKNFGLHIFPIFSSWVKPWSQYYLKIDKFISFNMQALSCSEQYGQIGFTFWTSIFLNGQYIIRWYDSWHIQATYLSQESAFHVPLVRQWVDDNIRHIFRLGRVFPTHLAFGVHYEVWNSAGNNLLNMDTGKWEITSGILADIHLNGLPLWAPSFKSATPSTLRNGACDWLSNQWAPRWLVGFVMSTTPQRRHAELSLCTDY